MGVDQDYTVWLSLGDICPCRTCPRSSTAACVQMNPKPQIPSLPNWKPESSILQFGLSVETATMYSGQAQPTDFGQLALMAVMAC